MKKLQCDKCNGSAIKKIGDLAYECQNCGKQYSQEELRKLYYLLKEDETFNNHQNVYREALNKVAGSLLLPSKADDIAGLLSRREKLSAIKEYREALDVGLSDARAAIERTIREAEEISSNSEIKGKNKKNQIEQTKLEKKEVTETDFEESDKNNQWSQDETKAKKEKGSWLHFSKSYVSEQKTENVFVIASMVLIVVLAFIFFGWSGISSFLSSPLIWKGQDSLEIHYMTTIEDKHYNEYDINVAVVNNTKEAIENYTFILNIAGEEIEVDEYSAETDNVYDTGISAFSVTTLKIPVYAEDFGGSLRSTKISKEALEELLANQKLDSLDVSWRIIELSSDGEELVKNTGTVKNIVIVAVSFIFGILGFFGGIRVTALRVIFKMLGIFAVLFVVFLIVFFAVIRYTTSAEGQAAQEKLRQEQDKMKKQKAAIEYKNAAQAKANATNARTAAYAQERMDRSMADMISGNPTATNAYKSAAHTKSVATAAGNHKLAAQAQAQMDKNMADILKDK